jgi:hypothetical protein
VAVYMCCVCDSFVDNDYFPCEEHSSVEGLVCPDCFVELPEEPELRVFTKDQQAFIKKMENEDDSETSE